MKKILLLMLTMLPLAVSAYDFEVDGLYYEKTGATEVAVVKGKKAYEGDVVIPGSIEVDGVAYAVTSIGDWAFASAKIQSVILPEGLQKIGFAAFGGSHITEIVIPSTVTTIDDEAFNGCGYDKSLGFGPGLDKVSVAEGNPRYDSRNGCNAIIETATDKLVQGLNSAVIPEGVKEIGSMAFYRMLKMESITFPAGIEEYGYNSFHSCWGLKDIYCLDETPVAATWMFGRPALDGFDFDKVVLHVPTGCKEKYEALEAWNHFKNISEFDPHSTPTGITSPTSGDDCTIYNIQGNKVTKSQGDRLPKGVYIQNGRKFVVK